MLHLFIFNHLISTSVILSLSTARGNMYDLLAFCPDLTLDAAMDVTPKFDLLWESNHRLSPLCGFDHTSDNAETPVPI